MQQSDVLTIVARLGHHTVGDRDGSIGIVYHDAPANLGRSRRLPQVYLRFEEDELVISPAIGEDTTIDLARATEVSIIKAIQGKHPELWPDLIKDGKAIRINIG